MALKQQGTRLRTDPRTNEGLRGIITDLWEAQGRGSHTTPKQPNGGVEWLTQDAVLLGSMVTMAERMTSNITQSQNDPTATGLRPGPGPGTAEGSRCRITDL